MQAGCRILPQTCSSGAVRVVFAFMAKKGKPGKTTTIAPAPPSARRPSALLDTRVIYCGDNLEQLAKLLDQCIDLSRGGIDPPFNSNRSYEVFWGETKGSRGVRQCH